MINLIHQHIINQDLHLFLELTLMILIMIFKKLKKDFIQIINTENLIGELLIKQKNSNRNNKYHPNH